MTDGRPDDLLARPIVPLAAAGAVAIVLAFRAGSGPALALGATLLGFVAFAAVYARLAARDLRAARDLAPRASEDDRIEVRFRVRNEGALPLYGVQVADRFPADRSPEKIATVYPVLGAFREVPARYRADCDARRGLYPVGPVSIVGRDPWGVARAARELDASVGRITVYPRVTPLARFADVRGAARFDVGTMTAGRAGVGLEFLGVREYREGDPPRLIHWPTSARAGRLIVREMEETAAADVALYLDLSRLAVRGLGRVSTVEYAIRLAASIATHVTHGPNRVRLYARGAHSYDVPAGAGEVHLAQLFETLAVARADGAMPLAALLRETAADLARGATAVVIFSSLEIDLAEFADVLELFRGRGVRFVAVLIEARTFLKVFDEQAAVEREAPALGEVAARLTAEGAIVYHLARGDDLAGRLAAPVASDPRTAG